MADKKKIKFQFSDDDIEKIIDLWSKKEVLFNCSDPDYFKKDARAAALSDIVEKAEIPGLTTEELQKKLTGLRTYYGKEIGKERASKVSGTGTKEVYTSKWPFFNSLHFLRDNITPRKTTSTFEANVLTNNEEDAVQEKEDSSVIDGCVFNTSNPPSSKSTRKATRKLEDELLSSCLQELKKPKPTVESTGDGDTIFGQYIANQLRKIPEGYRKEMLKIEIQQSIMKVMLDPTPTVRQPFSTIDFADLE